MKRLLTVLAIPFLAGLLGAALIALAPPQEAPPDDLLVRVFNPTNQYVSLVVKCGVRVRSIGLIDPGGGTDVKARLVELSCVGDSEAFLATVFENGNYVSWPMSKLRLDEKPLTGLLICIGTKQSALYRIPQPNEVPLACPGFSPSSSPSSLDVLRFRQV